MDHRPANLRPPFSEILIHHDHVDRPADPADGIAQTDGLCDAVLDVALDDQEVQIAVARELAACCRPEQDHPSRRARSLRETPSGQLNQLLRSHGQDNLPADAASTSSCMGQDDERLLYLGPSRSGALLEVVKVLGKELVIHAMRARPRYVRMLPGCEA